MAAAAASGHNSSLADNCRPLCSDFNLGAFRSAIFDYRPISLSLPLPLLPASLAPPLVIRSPSCFSSSDVDSDEPARRDQVPPELLARRRDQRRGKGRDLTYGGSCRGRAERGSARHPWRRGNFQSTNVIATLFDQEEGNQS